MNFEFFFPIQYFKLNCMIISPWGPFTQLLYHSGGKLFWVLYVFSQSFQAVKCNVYYFVCLFVCLTFLSTLLRYNLHTANDTCLTRIISQLLTYKYTREIIPTVKIVNIPINFRSFLEPLCNLSPAISAIPMSIPRQPLVCFHCRLVCIFQSFILRE